MTKRIEKITRKFKKAVQKKYSVIEMKLFGSSARGDSGKSSDIDIMVRLSKVDRSIEEDLFNIAYDLELEYDCVIDVIVLPQDIDRYRLFYENVKKDGILV